MSSPVPTPMNVVTTDPEERSMAALGHGSIVLNLFVPGLGIVAAAAVWLTQRDRSPFASRQALQAAVYQIVLALLPVGLGIIGVVIFAFLGLLVLLGTSPATLLVIIPFLVISGLVLLFILFIGLIYGLVAAYETYQGRDFRYWLIGDMLERK